MDGDSYILPQILAILSKKPNTCDNINSLCDEVEDNVATEHPDERPTDIRKGIKKALAVAQDLGIISITNEKIRLPFNFGGNQKRAPAIDDAADESMDEVQDNATKKISRRKSSSPRKRAPLSDDDAQYLFMTPRKNTTKSNHLSAMDRMGRRRSSRARRPRRGRASSRGRVSRRRVSRRRS